MADSTVVEMAGLKAAPMECCLADLLAARWAVLWAALLVAPRAALSDVASAVGSADSWGICWAVPWAKLLAARTVGPWAVHSGTWRVAW